MLKFIFFIFIVYKEICDKINLNSYRKLFSTICKVRAWRRRMLTHEKVHVLPLLFIELKWDWQHLACNILYYLYSDERLMVSFIVI